MSPRVNANYAIRPHPELQSMPLGKLVLRSTPAMQSFVAANPDRITEVPRVRAYLRMREALAVFQRRRRAEHVSIGNVVMTQRRAGLRWVDIARNQGISAASARRYARLAGEG